MAPCSGAVQGGGGGEFGEEEGGGGLVAESQGLLRGAEGSFGGVGEEEALGFARGQDEVLGGLSWGFPGQVLRGLGKRGQEEGQLILGVALDGGPEGGDVLLEGLPECLFHLLRRFRGDKIEGGRGEGEGVSRDIGGLPAQHGDQAPRFLKSRCEGGLSLEDP